MNRELNELTERLDAVALNLLGPLRLRKYIDPEAMQELKQILDRLRQILADEEYVPRKLTGSMWNIFCSMLAEADHARDPAPILGEAWDIQERLRKIFGPTW